jgi:hypothetical protein
MFNFFKKNKLDTNEISQIAKALLTETKSVFESYQLEMNSRLREIQAQLRVMDQNIEILDKKLSLKEHTDKQTYGQLHYRLEELKNSRKKLDN